MLAALCSSLAAQGYDAYKKLKLTGCKAGCGAASFCSNR